MTRLVLAVALLLGTPTLPTPALDETAPALALHIQLLYQLAPGHVAYRIAIAPHRDNYWFCMGWDNTTTLKGRTSCQQLNGIYSPRVFYQDYRDLAAGSYHGFVQLYRTPNYLAHTAVHPFNVILLFEHE